MLKRNIKKVLLGSLGILTSVFSYGEQYTLEGVRSDSWFGKSMYIFDDSILGVVGDDLFYWYKVGEKEPFLPVQKVEDPGMTSDSFGQMIAITVASYKNGNQYTAIVGDPDGGKIAEVEEEIENENGEIETKLVKKGTGAINIFTYFSEGGGEYVNPTSQIYYEEDSEPGDLYGTGIAYYFGNLVVAAPGAYGGRGALYLYTAFPKPGSDGGELELERYHVIKGNAPNANLGTYFENAGWSDNLVVGSRNEKGKLILEVYDINTANSVYTKFGVIDNYFPSSVGVASTYASKYPSPYLFYTDKATNEVHKISHKGGDEVIITPIESVNGAFFGAEMAVRNNVNPFGGRPGEVLRTQMLAVYNPIYSLPEYPQEVECYTNCAENDCYVENGIYLPVMGSSIEDYEEFGFKRFATAIHTHYSNNNRNIDYVMFTYASKQPRSYRGADRTIVVDQRENTCHYGERMCEDGDSLSEDDSINAGGSLRDTNYFSWVKALRRD